jgi:glycosidase
MNYRFSNLCRDFFARRSLSSKEFDEKLHAMIMHYKKPISFAQMNLLDSHDVPRFLSKCDGDLRKLKLAVFFQMTFVGIPSIFYGDEAAIQGTNELEYRSPMPWQDCPEQGELFQYIKKLILLRKTHAALTHGDFLTAETTDAGVYVFIRRTDTEKLLIALNNSDVERTVNVAPELTQPVFYSIFPQEEESASTKEIKLPPMSGKIVVLQGN